MADAVRVGPALRYHPAMRSEKFVRIPGDSSATVTWKNLPVIIAFVALLVFLTTADEQTRETGNRIIRIAGVVFSVALALVAVVALVRLARAKRHPALKVGRLVSEGRVAEACDLGQALLERSPDDPLVRINLASALREAGRPEDARQVFDGITEESVPPYLRPTYERLRPVYQC